MEGDVITLQDIFLFDFGMGVDEHGRFQGHLKATGVRPKFAEKLADLGIRLGPEVFQPEAFARRASGSRMMRRALLALGARRRRCSSLLAGGPAVAQDGGPDARHPRRSTPPTRRPSRSRSSTRASATRWPTSPCGRTTRSSTRPPAVPLDDQQSLGVVLVDRHVEVDGGERRSSSGSREAAHAFVDDKAATDQIAIVSFDGDVTLAQDFTTDEDRAPRGDRRRSPLEDGHRAVGRHRARPPHLLRRLAASSRTSSCSPTAPTPSRPPPPSRRRRAVEPSRRHAVRASASRTRASTRAAPSVADGHRRGVGRRRRPRRRRRALRRACSRRSRKQYVTTFAVRGQRRGAVPITAHGRRAPATPRSTSPGSNQQGAASLEPVAGRRAVRARLPPRRRSGSRIGLALVALAAVGDRLRRRHRSSSARRATLGQRPAALRRRLRRAPEFDDDDGDDGKGQQLAQTALLQRAVEATGSFAEQPGLPHHGRGDARAGQPAAAAGRGAVLLRSPASSLVAVLLVAARRQPRSAALIGVVIVALIPPAIADATSANRRRKQFEALLPDTLQLLAEHAAGRLLADAGRRGRVAGGRPSRWAGSSAGCVTEARLGRPLEEALDGIAERMELRRLRLGRHGHPHPAGGRRQPGRAAAHRAETMTERERLRRDVNALTAEGRISAIVLGLLPVGLGLRSSTPSTPSYIGPALRRDDRPDHARSGRSCSRSSASTG